MEELEYIEVRKKSVSRIYRQDVYDLFIAQNLNADEVAYELGVCVALIHKCLKKFGIKKPKELKELRKKDTCTKKYGVPNPMQSSEFKEKHKGSCLKKYGVDNVLRLESTKDKIRKTNLEKYGAENVFASEHGKQKIKETMLEKYGVENPMQLEEIKEKVKKTNLEKYGVEQVLQADEIKEKIKRTNLEKYGTECTFNNPQIREKIKETNLKKYGVENPLSSPDIRKKINETCANKYGQQYYTQVPEVKDKIKGTNHYKYGNYCVLNVPEIREKIRKTNLEKYGVEYYTQAVEMVEKSQDTMLLKYGDRHALRIPKFKEKARKTLQEHYGVDSVLKLPNFYSTWRKQRMLEKYGVENNSQIHLSKETLEILHNRDEFIQYLKHYTNKPSTETVAEDLKCSRSCVDVNIKKHNLQEYINYYYSYGEQELYELFPTEFRNVRDVIFKELDLYYPEEKIAIEFNGDYWHSTKRPLEKNYHYNKFTACYDKGIRLVQIYEHMWKNRNSRDLLIFMLARAFKKETEMFNLEELLVERISSKEASQLENAHNLRPSKNIVDAVGLLYNGSIILQVSVNKDNYINYTYVGNTLVSGGEQKLLNELSKNYLTLKYLADLDIDDIFLYNSMGFNPLGTINESSVLVDNYGNIVYNETESTYRINKSGLMEMVYRAR